MKIGIAGGTCSGKSTLAKLVAEALGSTAIIGLDAFYTRDMVAGPTLAMSDGATMFDFNHPDAIDIATAVGVITGATEPVVIVEGLFTLALEPLRECCDVLVFVDLDADLRAIRRLLRDMKGGRMSTDPEFIARYYIESARVGHARFVEPSRVFADIICTGDWEGMETAVRELVSRVGDQ